jgi:chromosome segregation ATPase
MEYEREKLRERENMREGLLSVLEEKSRKFEKEASLNEQLAQTAKKETEVLRGETAALRKDVEWLANSAKNNKVQAERAINDLEAYTKILRGMEKKLAETEVERESKEAELRELRQKLMLIEIQKQPQPVPVTLVQQQLSSPQFHHPQ